MVYIFIFLFSKCITSSLKYKVFKTFIVVPDEVSSLHFDDVSDRAVKVVWSSPKQSNGILIGYKLRYQVKDQESTMREEVFPPNATSVMIEHLEVI